ncbi:MAG: 16S rRNA (uracil(1498)-N(3))-methyltransferase [Alcanivorax sp.]|nr:16S rRNA (uracil(1498)-N(3))-methyltransferase [Alcanivorax sp.]MBI53794.1 16S rRNA (uracil(1498)-N(3))-methyltransferase [Alcanivorax sp.]MBM1142389.1 16S rRNA (uracil(1498)-N(3))-methyltransferase [Alcanivorax sp. ZXX171]HCE41814.1 16S rRNA (uracil(1498)-N(3))-methyltransferase [Alcanivorax sp.]|tara:strand:- start:43778 stop:44500 length:723 start_codon:yes stop_codon:yes gene_type:complete
MRRRFFDDQPFTQDQPVTLGAGPSHHIAKVLRMNPGDELTLFNGRGGEWSAVLESVGKKSVTARPLAFHERDRTAPVPVTLGLPLIKGDRMDYALQKATELGVAAIRVLDTERTEVRLKGERAAKKADHWWQVVISACEQCGLNRPPALDGPLPLKDFLAAADGLALIAHPGEAPLEAAALRDATAVTLLTGPEGGFSDPELAAARAAGFLPFALGERVLRAETAPVALLASLWAGRLLL